MIFHSDDSNDDITKEWGFGIFEYVIGDEEVDLDSYLDTDRYCISLKNPYQFHIIVDDVIAGLLLSMSYQIIQVTKD